MHWSSDTEDGLSSHELTIPTFTVYTDSDLFQRTQRASRRASTRLPTVQGFVGTPSAGSQIGASR